MYTPDEIKEAVMALMDKQVSDLSLADYRETLEAVISECEMRLEAAEADDNR